jgi:hypothetical protein
MDREGIVAGSGIRGRWRDLEPSAVEADPNKAFAPYMSLAPVTPLGHNKVTVGTTPVGLPNIPEGAKRVVLYSMTNLFVYRDDGVSPSSTDGMPIPAETHFIYDTDPDENFLMWAASDTVVRVAYYG